MNSGWRQRPAAAPVAGVTLELGGKSPVIVLSDAGQVCAARDIYDALINRVAAKARAMTMGHPRDDPDRADRPGYFHAPILFTDVPKTAEIARDEVFGPVLTTHLVDGEEDALALANDSPFGLVAGIYTRDCGAALRLARRVDAGQVFVNGFLTAGDAVPFGGVKQSGIGREKGLAGLTAYLAPKFIIFNHAGPT